MIKKLELIDKKQFAKAVLDKKLEIFIVYIIALKISLAEIKIYFL